MEEKKVRVRFAPSPTGMMHLGNVRTALMNYLFAKQKNGTFVLRIEDTDPERNFDPEAKHIISDLQWLELHYDEGPLKGGPFAPYFQSKRSNIYQEKLQHLIKNKQVYRCFCTQEELSKKRERQIALKMPPRYDKTCLKLSDNEVQKKLDANIPFVWRVKLDPESKVTIQDITHGTMEFDLKHFSDFPITRQNGTFTFMFANFIDDMVMEISHVLRGEDHLSNTAGQAVLYQLFNAPAPIFWHMPILCNIEGKKLSKRDFGFSLQDMKKSGYLQEAVCNYLAIIGGSFKDEIMSLDQLAQTLNFDKSQAKGQIKYDTEKLNWVNRKWIAKYDPQKLTALCLPFLIEQHPQAAEINKEKLTKIIQIIQTDLVTLNDIKQALNFYFEAPDIQKSELLLLVDEETTKKIGNIIEKNIDTIGNPDQFLSNVKTEIKEQDIAMKNLFLLLRFVLMGAPKGPGIKELVEILGTEEAKKRIETLLKVIKL